MNPAPPFASNVARRPDDDEKSSSSDGTVEEPTESEQRYAALRNHQIRFADAIDPNAEKVFKLRKKDIVFGRGRGFQNHPGNERMRNIIEKYKTQYHSLNRDGKRQLVENVHKEITQGGARFLKKLDGQNAWVVVDLPIALQKVSHTMRCRKSVIRQLDEHGKVPNGLAGLGGPASHLARAVTQLPPHFPGMHTAASLPGVLPSITIPGMPPHGAAHAGIHGISQDGALHGIPTRPTDGVPASSPTGPAGELPSLGTAPSLYHTSGVGGNDPSLAALEAERMAALHRYRVLSGMAVARQGDIEYYQRLRKEQLLRETRMLQQMGDAALLGPGGTTVPGPGPLPGTQLSPPPVVPSATVGAPNPAAVRIPGASPMPMPGASPLPMPAAPIGAPAPTGGNTAAPEHPVHAEIIE